MPSGAEREKQARQAHCLQRTQTGLGLLLSSAAFLQWQFLLFRLFCGLGTSWLTLRFLSCALRLGLFSLVVFIEGPVESRGAGPGAVTRSRTT